MQEKFENDDDDVSVLEKDPSHLPVFFLFKIRSFKKYLGRFIPNGTYCKETHRKKTDTETEKTIYYYFQRF